ncbi:V-type immunoglobulin domain-containing suppressor of T-cell activation [Salminus brasiliensis]|uniref:V-type immunoglobulin domain-containing suppressor of T-cell activation n=1 Tax=Salminus brasiliensis TaxID=930266 RepID=UPI003B832422
MDLTAAVCLVLSLFLAVRANSDHHAHSFSVSTPHISYTCPEGANVTLVCTQSGALAHPKDRMQYAWLFTAHMDQRCHDHSHPRSLKNAHGNRSLGVVYGAQAHSFSVTLLDVTHKDQGRYCCLSLDLLPKDNHKASVQQSAHSHILLTIIPRRDDLNCTVFEYTAPQASVAAGLATAACIMGILCLPLILVLVYRQRQGAHGSRRAHELVRMDSEAQGHENPVFMAGSPQPRTRTVSQILTRQSSETGRHLLSDPGTPLTPNPHGDVFFPAQEPIPESPDFMQV